MKLKNKLEKLGFTEWHTGGGCMALRKDFADGTYFLITDDDGIGFENLESKVMVGFYDTDESEDNSVFAVMSSDFNNHKEEII